MLKDRRGFTLIELAIVLVIIGIILGAILKGQSLINNARAKRTLNDMRGLEAMAWTFYDRYGRFPGDCPAYSPDGTIDNHVNGHWTLAYLDTSTTAPTTPCSATGGTDDRPFNDLKWAGIADKTAPNRQAFKNAFNGPFYLGYETVNGVNYNVIAVNNIPCWVAKMIDQSIDNGLNAGVGRIRELIGTTVRNGNYAWSCTKSEDTLVSLVYFFDKQP